MSRPPLIYLAAPYSDPDPEVVKDRMERFYATHAMLLARGDVTVSPLLNHQVVGRHTIKGDWAFWRRYSETLLARCDEMWVVTLPGHETSPGVLGEIDFARSRAIPVIYIDEAPRALYRLDPDESDRDYADRSRAATDEN
jgi:hypothetical protein